MPLLFSKHIDCQIQSAVFWGCLITDTTITDDQLVNFFP